MEKTTQRGALYSVLLIKYYSGEQIKKNEMGRACSTYGARGGANRFDWGHWRERNHSKNRRGKEGNIKMDLQGVGSGGMEWVALVQDKAMLRALVNAVMNLRVP